MERSEIAQHYSRLTYAVDLLYGGDPCIPKITQLFLAKQQLLLGQVL